MTRIARIIRRVGLVGLIGLVVGCAGTVTPRVVQSSRASWDGGEQTSGILNAEVINGKKWFHVTAHFRERYNEMIATYGKRIGPWLKPDDGIAHDELGPNNVDGKDYPSDYHIDADHMAYFERMNRWRKQEGPTK